MSARSCLGLRVLLRFVRGLVGGCVPALCAHGLGALGRRDGDRVLVSHPLEHRQRTTRRAVDDAELVLLEVRQQRLEASTQGVVERVVVTDRAGLAGFVEGVLAVLGHREIAPEQIHSPEAEVVEQTQGREHDAAFALDPERVGLLALVAPRDGVAGEKAFVVEVIAATVEQDAGHLADMEGAGSHGTVVELDAQPMDAMTDRHELQDARIFPARIYEPARIIDTSPERRAVHGPCVVDAHRDDAALVEQRKVELVQGRAGEHEERRAASVEVGHRDGVELGGVEAQAGAGGCSVLEAVLEGNDVGLVGAIHGLPSPRNLPVM